MNKALIITTSSELKLAKTKKLMSVTKKLLAKNSQLSTYIDKEWMVRLWEWADENDISEDRIPRVLEKLMQLTWLDLSENQFTTLPKEIGQLTQLTELYLFKNPNLLLSTEQKEWISKLIENGCEVR
jgi:Leucine-rich repeat (LRR) protein